jgi:hypothetical protein
MLKAARQPEEKNQKGQSLKRGPALCKPPDQRIGYNCLCDEALPLNSTWLQFASCRGRSTRDAVIDEVAKNHYRQHNTNHKAPSFCLSLNVDSRIAAQMLIGVVAVEIGFTGVRVSFVPVVKVILHFIVGHDVTSLVGCFVRAIRSFRDEQKMRQYEKDAMRTE